MKLHFEDPFNDDRLTYQKQAIEAVCDLFKGQEVCRSEFTVTSSASGPQSQMFGDSGLGIGNRLGLLWDDLLRNLNAVQLRNGLRPTVAEIEKDFSHDFTVEMETGTGKTYVYLRTAFELHRRYGFTKFVIVVPSVAIKEGVFKSLQMVESHFRAIYGNTWCEPFIYDSSKLGQVRNFATSASIQVMVMTVGAINKFGDEDEAQAEETTEAKRREKSKNVMYRAQEKIGGEKPIDLIRDTRPIVIVDEPQSVDGGMDGKGKKALARMNPLCTLRYSATHVDKHQMVYRLTAVDAYQQKLVKQIEVAAATIEAAHNKPYVKLLSVSNKKGRVQAVVELDCAQLNSVQRRELTVFDGDDLEQTTNRAVYAGCRVGDIISTKGAQRMELRVPGGEHYLHTGQAYGDVDASAVQREMIRRTIKEHLDKELRLGPLGIKVLSLFFIDAVAKYREFDEASGTTKPGEYARIFEEEYTRFGKSPTYASLFGEVDWSHAASAVHKGYFSIDKKVGSKSVEVFKDTSGSTAADDDAYKLIMVEKETLLDMKTPLKFIFSHSALREGWDNPNVFQICSLRDMSSERQRRQSIGRGLRLCVNQQGERLRGFEVNTLTVIAKESFEQFAEQLQQEIESETGIHFGIVEDHQFAGVAVDTGSGSAPMGYAQSKLLHAHLKGLGYINTNGKVQDTLRTALKAGTLQLPPGFEAQRAQIIQILTQLCGKLEIKNADKATPVLTRQAVLQSEEFKALWDRIKHKTTYRVAFDNEKLLTDCTVALREAPAIDKTRLQWSLATLGMEQSGITAIENKQRGAATVVLNETDIHLPDLLTELQDRTHLTRRSLAQILTDSGRLNDFKRNPQQFITLCAEIINRCKRMALVDGIRYVKLDDSHFYAQELFINEELKAYLDNTIAANKSVHERVVYDSNTERDFAEALEKNDAIKVYAKLPSWFKVPTPLGSYNPDWAVLMERDGEERLYFVVETKSSLFTDDLRDRESGKIKCGEAHFEQLAAESALPSPARFMVAIDATSLLVSAAT